MSELKIFFIPPTKAKIGRRDRNDISIFDANHAFRGFDGTGEPSCIAIFLDKHKIPVCNENYEQVETPDWIVIVDKNFNNYQNDSEQLKIYNYLSKIASNYDVLTVYCHNGTAKEQRDSQLKFVRDAAQKTQPGPNVSPIYYSRELSNNDYEKFARLLMCVKDTNPFNG